MRGSSAKQDVVYCRNGFILLKEYFMKLSLLVAIFTFASFSSSAYQEPMLTSSSSITASIIKNDTSSSNNECDICVNPACYGCDYFSDASIETMNVDVGIRRR